MMTRAEAIEHLRSDAQPLPDGEAFSVDYFTPQDAYGVARLMFAVYGDGHPIDTYYIPEQLIEENRAGRIRSAVARTDSGQVVCHVAFYRSSAPNPELYELGMGLTLPSYRGSLAFARCTGLLVNLLENKTITAIFGEAVCNHIITQKTASPVKFVETGMELELMPNNTYQKEQAAEGRVSCLLLFRVEQDHERPICIPDCYADQLRFMMAGLGLKRQLLQPTGLPLSAASELQTERFPSAGVCRCNIIVAGQDLAEQLAVLELELRGQGYALLQCFIPLDTATAAKTVVTLRNAGFFLGGFLPVWFGADGLLMQKLFVEPCFDAIKLYSERSRAILELVRADWQRSKALGTT